MFRVIIKNVFLIHGLAEDSHDVLMLLSMRHQKLRVLHLRGRMNEVAGSRGKMMGLIADFFLLFTKSKQQQTRENIKMRRKKYHRKIN